MNLQKIFAQSLKEVEKIGSYRCVMELSSWDNGQNSTKQRYVYRAPGDVRIEQLGPFRKGAVVVIRTDGTIRARGGGLLSRFTVPLGRDSELLKGVTGDSAVDSDWLSILRKANTLARFVAKSEVSSVSMARQRGYEVIAELRDQPYDRIRMIIREDGPVLLLERYRKGDMRAQVKWIDIEINPEVRDNEFSL
jgi:outer membrane lipoprotein-sorting protein